MKKLLLLFLGVCAFLPLYATGDTTDQAAIYRGCLVIAGNPPAPDATVIWPGLQLGLQTDTALFYLTIDSFWIPRDYIIIDGIEYRAGPWEEKGDSVEIYGTKSVIYNSYFNRTYYQLEIISINRPEENTASERMEPNTLSAESFPNPTCGDIGINVNKYSTIAIFSANGVLVMHKNISPGKHTFTLKNTGMHLIKITDDMGHSIVKKIVKY